MTTTFGSMAADKEFGVEVALCIGAVITIVVGYQIVRDEIRRRRARRVPPPEIKWDNERR